MTPQIPDPFYVEILKGITAVETELKGIKHRLDSLATKHEVEALQREVILHRWVIGGFFSSLVLVIGWVLTRGPGPL